MKFAHSTSYEKSYQTEEMGGEKEQLRKMAPIRTTSRRNRNIAMGLAIAVIIYLSSSLPSLSVPTFQVSRRGSAYGEGVQNQVSLKGDASTAVEGDKVPLEAHIMSKCPDARDCLKTLVIPAMQKISDKVNFTLSYIGKPTANDGVECMHGATECLGNIMELCVARLYPSPINYLGFTMCLSETYQDIPQRYLVEGCALEHGIDFDKLNECASEDDGALGMGMLRESIGWSSSVGVTKSCTIRLNEQIYCIRDGGKWKDCESGPGVNDLVLAVEKLYRANN